VYYRAIASREVRRLFIVVGEAALIVTGAYFGLVLITFKFALTPGEETIEGIMMAILPVGVATWWIFRRLQTHHPPREARAAAIAFVVFAPIALLMALIFTQLFGDYAIALLGNPMAFPGTLVGIVVMISILTFVAVVSTLWIMRLKNTQGSPKAGE
jgi:hypothetical protein